MTCGEIEFIWPLASHAIATSPRVSSLTDLARAARRRAAGRRRSPGRDFWPEAALGDEAAQDDGGAKRSPWLLRGALQPLEHHVEALDVGLHERRQQPAARVEAGAGHHPEVDVAVGGDALLEHQAGLDEASSA